MTELLAGRRIMITGASGGLGSAIARTAAKANAEVLILADVNTEGTAALCAELIKSGTRAIPLALNVADEDSWAQAMSQVTAEAGGVDVLVNNAGITNREGVLDTKLEDWNRVIAVNQTGVFLGMKHAAELMVKDQGGAIVNIASFASYTGYQAVSYTASKWAVRGITQTAANELGPLGVRVNSVSPGFVNTPLTHNAPNLVRSFALEAPLRRECDPQDIADAVVFLSSAQSSYITGQDIVVDGGFMSNQARNLRA
ncbi:MAG: SDR family NAD(P)-dependent oxidoreductase [Leucobacter sp.]